MPYAAAKVCNKAGCGRSRCGLHPLPNSNWEKWQAGKTSSQRGYDYQWQKKRERILKRDNYQCLNCKCRGYIKKATDVDHVKPKSQGGSDDDSNLQSLCDDCHKAKTAREGGVNPQSERCF